MHGIGSRWLHGEMSGEGSGEEPLLRPVGQGVDAQCACVVLVKSFAVSSASCLPLLIIIMVCWPKAFRKQKGSHQPERLNVP